MQQIQLGKTLDVEVVEQELAALWQGSTGAPSSDDETAVLRARAANLLVFVTNEQALNEVEGMLEELTAVHPSRVLTMCCDRVAADRDIDMYVAAFGQKDKRAGPQRLCCEHVTLKAQGSFVAELPSAALPLVVSDLPTFLWWRTVVDSSQKVFSNLLHASDRLIVDSAEFAQPVAELLAINGIFQQHHETPVGISDLNWARLTSWRGLLADFYDVAEYRTALEEIDDVCISYVAPQADTKAIAPQALLMAGWLASRLQWKMLNKPATGDDVRTIFEVSSQRGQTITVELHRTEEAAIHPGRLAHVELQSSTDV